ncbi:hypothetical protein Mapa_008527 [Marchantia paleacea]|nr:hypothetical protein Mapa_008527 [Marchantia paleacea]
MRNMELMARWTEMGMVCLVLIASLGFSQAHRIDLHTHILPPFYNDWLAEQGYGPATLPAWSPSLHLEYMESIGTTTSVVSITTPGVGPFNNNSLATTRSMARKLNQYSYDELAKKYPGKFQFWATVTLPDVEGSIAEAKYALEELNATGIFLESNKLGIYLGDPAFDPFFQLLNDMHALVFIHPAKVPDVRTIPGLPQGVVDFTLDMTRAAVNLVFTNTTQKYPNITYILANAGGSVTLLAYRIALASQYYSLPVMIEEFKQFYYDTTFSSTPSAMPTILQFATPDRMTFGTDWPQGQVVGTAFYTQTLDEYPLDKSEREKIYRANAKGLFRRNS